MNSVDAKTKPEFRAILICDVGDEVTLKHYFPWTIRNRRVMFAEDTIQVVSYLSNSTVDTSGPNQEECELDCEAD